MTKIANQKSYIEFLTILSRSTELLNEEPMHDELYSVERLEQYAPQLAGELTVTDKFKKGKSLRPELKRCQLKLESAYTSLAGAIQNKQPVSPAAEWFVDNFHIIETQLREIKLSLPDTYYYGLPQLDQGELKGYPRVYAIALAIVAHTDCRFDPTVLGKFLVAFQKATPLKIGELWALVITIRFVLVQQLTVLSHRILSAMANREKANALADKLLLRATDPEVSEKETLEMLSKELGETKTFNRSFIVQLIQRLRDQDPNVWPAFDFIESKLQELQTSSQRVTQLELHRQASGQVTIGNIIGSMRLLSSLDWREFIENVNLVDPILAGDPAGAYLKMDFGTRDHYRHALEHLSKRSEFTEMEVAQRAITAALGQDSAGHQGHVGYYLIGKGRESFEKSLHYKPELRESFNRFVSRHPTFFYLGSLLVFTCLLLIPVLNYYRNLHADLWFLVAFGCLAVFPASDLALSLLNHYITNFIRPAALPRIDTEKGIPAEAGTMVVIPTLFTKEPVIKELLERLEIHYLANPDPVLSFALLGDYADALAEKLPADEKLLSYALDGIEALNHRYPGPHKKFHLFHRKRRFNESEGAWIGWERKRGKLLEFNRLLRGATDTSYIVATAEETFLKTVKYVITLDSDSQLPRDAAAKLVGTILHPLNQPQFDPKVRRVTAGYGILQPRISITAGSAKATRFARVSSGNIGIDPYTTAVSDVYQDLFQEGSFTGKGLYVVDAFELAMDDRVPENAVLSHDLFEGSYARSALVTDVELFDDYPGDYETFSKRQHRWTRGDWQILAWLFPRVPDAHGKRVKNDLTIISRWKIFDNLRRTLVPIASLAWLVLSWTLLPGSPAFWTSLIVMMYFFPVYSTVTTGHWMQKGDVTWQGYFHGGIKEFKLKINQILLTVTFLTQQAYTQADAIVRVFYRMLVSRKKLLEWTSFAQLQSKKTAGPKFISSGPVLGILIGLLVFYVRPEALWVASPFIVLWLLNPMIKRWIAGAPKIKEPVLTGEDVKEFRSYARMTWHFFETFVGPEDNWLAPDNYQEEPKPVVAHRTSPTNIGLQLLATASAYDLGYIGRTDLVTQMEKTFETLGKLATLHGHFYNWYDTLNLEPLNPRYVSTVDSGNLAGHLLTFKQVLADLSRKNRSYEVLRLGLEDSLNQLHLEISGLHALSPATGAVSLVQAQEILRKLLAEVRATRIESAPEWKVFLSTLHHELTEAEDIVEVIALEASKMKEDFDRGLSWMRSTLLQVRSFLSDIDQDWGDLTRREALLMRLCEEMALGMDFRFLFDERRKLFVIGFNVLDSRRDNSYYDLLASESRLASFVAIAKGDVSQEHWFRLGRTMAAVKGGRALIAWTATMFEYLMPVLVMKRYADTLLEQTYKAVVGRQIEYGEQKGVPWGVSESGFNARDLQMNYQYGPFGIPGLGLKRGLSDELVVSPYSTMLAALIDPLAALSNLQRLVKLGAFGRFGFYESIDYTAERLPSKQKFVILKSYMAHHQGMSLLALNNILNGFIMQDRFHAEPLIQATELLLQERVPKSVELSQPRSEEIRSSGFLHSSMDSHPRLYSDVNLSLPRTQLLSNGTYSVMVTSTGAGYSKCGPLAVTRWREDATRDHWGQYFYIRNRTTNHFWSATHQPTGVVPKSFGATFSEDKVAFWRRDEQCLTLTEILVSQEDNVELRRISITNESAEVQEFEVTSFMETVIAKPNDDAAHPAFSNLFVQTEYLSSGNALLGTRRARSNKENPPFAFHVATTDSPVVGAVQYETDRSRFIGRGRDVTEPIVIQENRPLSNTVGSVLDPIFSLRQTVRIEPGETTSVTFITGLVQFRQEAIELIDKYRDVHTFKRESEIAWTQSQVLLRHLNITNAKAHIYQRLAGRVLYLDSSLRPASHVLAQNSRAQTNLWAYGISGDLPIIMTQISDEKDMALVRELLHAHEYLRLKGLMIDLVILNERAPSYLQTLQDELLRQIRMSGSQALLDKPGGIFLRRTDLIPNEDIILLRTVSRVILNAEKGSLEEQLKLRKAVIHYPQSLVAKTTSAGNALGTSKEAAFHTPDLDFYNGLGGFADGGKEYVIILKEGQWTPAPWINVIANSHDFGFIVSESGLGYTWSANSRENRLTPWSNDPVSDPAGEVIYLRDEDSGKFWSMTPLPIREPEPYLIRHGQGYTRFEHTSHGIEQSLEVFVALEAGVKFGRVKLKNTGSTPRRISVTSYVEWVLGFHRGSTAAYIIPEHDPQTGAILARNPYNNEFASRIAFADISEVERSFTCDRREFIGRNGSLKTPAALTRVGLSGTTGAGVDPCAAFQTKLEIAPGETATVVIVLGQADTVENARHVILKYRDKQQVESALQSAKAYWEKTLNVIEIKTPDKAMDLLVNKWLLYQTLSCRIWARSAFYQSGGAFGFRDQLQDVMALAHSHPQITRAQILTAAARQFKEGDVQHWWHPPTGRGVRTHFSDDLIWLPFVVTYYVKLTGDTSVLDEVIPFIEAPVLLPGQDDAYTHPQISDDAGTIYEHCARTLDRSLKVGAHGLPLMGAGDWNDGMSRVGHEGRGESVWVAWFLYTTLKKFIPLCERAGDQMRIEAYQNHLVHIKDAVEKNAWDGDWYRRAYFDDGTPLGSATNEECRIDSISQSWAVLSGAGDPGRSQRAMAAVDEYLIHRGDGLIKLFTPPFDRTSLDPGYIKGYVPGVRENGGQYTHAAIWTLMAYAELGDGDKATELYALLNPINHSSTRAGLHKYKVEPYVVAADIYGLHPHVGRGGWTWYTGSASWMYRAALESILGFEVEGAKFKVKPRIPLSWGEFEITYRKNKTVYNVKVLRSADEAGVVRLDGTNVMGEWINIIDDGRQHEVRVMI
ncbi:MAG TPA: glucoamylase family protein [Bacteriovoracaceae bacterium]|nr:glucoamylase family protein [Bacteriovoracaceae bacterium]